ncbi:MAG TPA: TrkA family potassium uptake protein [Ruminiclostridium sp.]|nr:TrkA family potassium uptake protein [Ruminiclostridium sp.]
MLAIDHNPERVQRLSNEFTHILTADTTDEHTLEEIGIRNFDAVIVAIGENVQANILTTLQLKELGVNYIVVKAQNLLHGKMLEKIGADKIIYPERDMGKRVAHNLMSTNVLEHIELSPNLGLVEVKAPQSLLHHTLAESNLRAKFGINVVAIKRGDDLIVSPLAQQEIISSDVLIVVGSNVGIQQLERLD